jgi:hypothetical protein
MAKKTPSITAVDRKRYARARARGRAEAKSPSAVVNARYDRRRDCIEMTFRAGVSIAVPRKLVPGLEDAATSSLKLIHVSPAGDALSWRALDLYVYVPSLLNNLLFARNLQSSLK